MALSILAWSRFCAGNTKLQRRSEVAVTSEHVLSFFYDTENRFVNGIVQASMKDRSYKVWLSLGSNNDLIDSHCECPNGQDACHHKATLLLYGYKNVSKTDIRQSWIKNPKSRPPKVTQTMEELFPPSEKLVGYRATQRSVNAEDRANFSQELAQLGRFTAMHWILAPEPPTPRLEAPVVEDVLASEGYLAADNKQAFLRKALILDSVKIKQVAELTTGQRTNSQWAAIRKYRLTASNFGCVMGAIERNRFPPSLFKRLIGAYNLDRKDAIIWGITHENVALERYCSFGDAVVQPTGIWLHESGVLGASPDGLIDIPARYGFSFQDSPSLLKPRILELKCPYQARDLTIDQAVDKIKDFCLEKKPDGGFRLKTNHTYYDQVQGQMYLTNAAACDFAVWTPKDCAIVRISRNSTWMSNINKMIEFYFAHYIPYLESL